MARAARSRSWWVSTVRRWKRSGLDARAFAETEGVSERTLRWWSSTLRRGTRAERGSTESVAMVPIEVQLPATRSETVAVRTASIDVVVGEVTLRVGADTDVAYVGALVAALLRAKS